MDLWQHSVSKLEQTGFLFRAKKHLEAQCLQLNLSYNTAPWGGSGAVWVSFLAFVINNTLKPKDCTTFNTMYLFLVNNLYNNTLIILKG